MIFTIKKLWRNEFYKGSFFVMISAFIISILNYFFNILAGRSLGPAGFGEITALFSYMAIISIPISILSTIVIQKVSEAEENDRSVVLSLEDFLYSKIKRWWFVFVGLLAIIPLLPRITNLSAISAFSLIPLIFISFLATFYSASLQGLKLFLIFSTIGIVCALIKLLGAVSISLGIGGLTTIVIFIFVSIIVGLLISIVIVKREVKEKINDSHRLTKINKRLLHIFANKQFVITTISIIGLTLFGTIDIIFVKKFFTSDQAGIYSSWSLFAKIILYFVGPINIVTFVFFSRKRNYSQQNKTLIIVLILLLFVSIAAYICYTLFSSFVINLFFGKKFESVIPLLSSASIFGLFFAVITIMNNFYMAKKSYFSLILPLATPFYIMSLFLITRQLTAIIQLNIIFSIVVSAVYLLSFCRTMRSTA